jgi:hypothetical protein
MSIAAKKLRCATPIAVSACAVIAESAAAQYETTDVALHFALGWAEVDPQGHPVPAPNGLVEPGEGVRFSISVALTPGVGTTVAYTGGGTGFATVGGIGGALANLFGSGGASGTWDLTNAVPAEWSLGLGSSVWGSVGGAGSEVWGLQFGQFPPYTGPLNPANPLQDVWHGVWLPQSYSGRVVNWRIEPPITDIVPMSEVILQNSQWPIFGARCVSDLPAPLPIPIIPAPGLMTAGAVAIGTSALIRRRKSRPS